MITGNHSSITQASARSLWQKCSRLQCLSLVIKFFCPFLEDFIQFPQNLHELYYKFWGIEIYIYFSKDSTVVYVIPIRIIHLSLFSNHHLVHRFKLEFKCMVVNVLNMQLNRDITGMAYNEKELLEPSVCKCCKVCTKSNEQHRFMYVLLT